MARCNNFDSCNKHEGPAFHSQLIGRLLQATPHSWWWHSPSNTAGEMGFSCTSTLVDTVDDLMTTAFPNQHRNCQNLNWLCERATLAPQCTFVVKLNKDLLQTFLETLIPTILGTLLKTKKKPLLFPQNSPISWTPLNYHLLNGTSKLETAHSVEELGAITSVQQIVVSG